MPRKHEKLLERARNNKAGWKSRDLITLLNGYGFELSTINSSHHTFVHYRFKDLRMTVKHPEKELHKFYVSETVKKIDKVLEYQKGQ